MAAGSDGKQQAQPSGAPPNAHCRNSSSRRGLPSLLLPLFPPLLLIRDDDRRTRKIWRRSSGMARSSTRFRVHRPYSPLTRSVKLTFHTQHTERRICDRVARHERNNSVVITEARTIGTRTTANETVIFLGNRAS